MSFSSDSKPVPSDGEKKLRVVVITGATRCGKTLLTEWLEKQSLRDSDERLAVIHQDDYWIDSSEMPKVSLQGAPYIKVTYWDADECVDWAELILHVEAQRNIIGDKAPTTLVIEGNMLLSQKYFLDIATEIVCISIDKWKCFDRRVASDSKRQCYLPYMIEMWKSHMKRFNLALKNKDALQKMHFVPCEHLVELTQTSTTGLASAINELIKPCTMSPSVFLLILNGDAPYPNTFTPIDICRFDHLYGERFGNVLRLPETSANDTLLLHSLYAMLLGNAYGDAAGAWCEFHHQKPVVWADGALNIPLVLSGRGGVRAAPPGAVTDDFQMTLTALKTLIKNNMRYVARDHVMAYIDWASQNPGGIGINTRALLQHPRIKDKARTYEKYLEAFREKHSDPTKLSKSNGTLMRASAFAAIKELSAAVAAAAADAEVTNNNTINRYANAIYVAIIYNIINRKVDVSKPLKSWINADFLDRDVNVAFLAEAASSGNSVDADEMRTVQTTLLHAIGAVSDSAGDMSKLVNDKERKGYVLVALWVALRYYDTFYRESLSVREVLRRVVCLGGDTDTNAAITGALICSSLQLDQFCALEKDNLNVLMNCQYDYATVKNINNLRPSSLPKVMEQLFYKLTSTPQPTAEQSSSTEASTSATSVGDKKKRDDDDGTEEFDVEIVRKEKQQKLTK